MAIGTVTIFSLGVYENGIVNRRSPLAICDWLKNCNNYAGFCADCHGILERIQDRRADSPDYTPEQRGES